MCNTEANTVRIGINKSDAPDENNLHLVSFFFAGIYNDYLQTGLDANRFRSLLITVGLHHGEIDLLRHAKGE